MTYDRESPYERLARAQEFGQDRSIMQMRTEVQALRAVVLSMLAAWMQGTAPDLQSEPFHSFLGGAASDDPMVTINRLITQAGVVLGKVNCPTCGAMVDDRVGVTDEQCIFCGGTVPTQR